MKVSPHGFGYTTKQSSFVPIVVDEFRKRILEKIRLERVESFRGEPKGRSQIQFASNPSIPEEAGWTFLINENHPLRNKIIDAIQRLAVHRIMDKPRVPLLYRDQPKELWNNWINQYLMLKRGRFQEPPKYILIIGDPQSIPLGFQAKLSTVSFVGRLDFDKVSEIEDYARKVESMETNDNGFVDREVTFFATDHGITSTGCYDPTHFTRYDVENELIPNVNGLGSKLELGNNFSSNKLVEADATKENLKNSIQESKPAVFFSSCWGMCAPEEPISLQREFNGSIICQGDPENTSYQDLLFTSKDVNTSSPFLEGGIFIQQSSFGFGTPKSSEIHSWVEAKNEWKIHRNMAPLSFVSSLPKKLVFHPHGPLAYVGFLDEMLSYTVSRDEDFSLLNRQERVSPISNIVEKILVGSPVGFALKPLKDRLNLLNDDIVDETAEILRKINEGKQIEDNQIKQVTDKLLQRHEAKNYLIFGDPAVRIKNWL